MSRRNCQVKPGSATFRCVARGHCHILPHPEGQAVWLVKRWAVRAFGAGLPAIARRVGPAGGG